jgi:hypothetical protein
LNDGGTATLPMPVVRCPVARKMIYRCGGAAQFANCPQLASALQITLLEEEKVSAYFGAVIFNATAFRGTLV